MMRVHWAFVCARQVLVLYLFHVSCFLCFAAIFFFFFTVVPPIIFWLACDHEIGLHFELMS